MRRRPGPVLVLLALLASVSNSVAGRDLAGKLLVATPEQADSRFAETVIYLVDHDAEGAFGLIVNKPMATGPLADFLAGVGIEAENPDDRRLTLFYGGPVEPDTGWVLHGSGYASETTRRISDGIAFTAGREALAALGAGEGPERYLVLLGYAGWGPGQLEAEIARGDWLTAPADADLVFAPDHADKWQRARGIGGLDL